MGSPEQVKVDVSFGGMKVLSNEVGGYKHFERTKSHLKWVAAVHTWREQDKEKETCFCQLK